jgi:hypothetical protein
VSMLVLSPFAWVLLGFGLGVGLVVGVELVRRARQARRDDG